MLASFAFRAAQTHVVATPASRSRRSREIFAAAHRPRRRRRHYIHRRYALCHLKRKDIGGSMFRLIKLGIYVLLGYALYELYQGMMAEAGGEGGAGKLASTPRRGAARITGGGQGRRE